MQTANEVRDRRLVLLLAGSYLFFYLFGAALSRIAHELPLLYWLVDLGLLTAYPIAAFIYLKARGCIVAGDIGFHKALREGWGANRLALEVVWILSIWVVGFYLVGQILWIFLWPYDKFAVEQSMRPSSGLGWLTVGLLWSFAPAVVEETFFRGFGDWAARNFLSAGNAERNYVFGSASFFAVGHFAQGLTIVFSAFILGVMLSKHYLRIRNVVPFILAHAIFNAMALFF